jgi:hypothetical protein
MVTDDAARDPIPADPLPARGDHFLAFLLLLASVFWLAQAYWEEVDMDREEAKASLHAEVLRNEAPAPYQYKNWLPGLAFDGIQRAGGFALRDVFLANTLLSLAFLVFLHFLWLKALVGVRAAAFGAVLLAALCHCLFRIHYHHPYEFWGVGLYCLLLLGVWRGWRLRWLLALALVTGLVWEKHALVAPAWGLWRLFRGERFTPAFVQSLLLLAASLLVPIAVRLWLDKDLEVPRAQVDGDVPLSLQAWNKVLWYQAPFVLPFVLVLLGFWRRIPSWVKMLWIALPLLVLAYALMHYNLHEARSFWALAPVFTATAVCAVDRARIAREARERAAKAP